MTDLSDSHPRHLDRRPRPLHRRLRRPPPDDHQGARPLHRLLGLARRSPRTRSQSHVVATVNLASVDTGDAGRDAHLRNADFFDLDGGGSPTMTFVSTGIKDDDGDYVLFGDLTINGVTRQVEFDARVRRRERRPVGQHQGRLHAPRPRSTARTSASSGTSRSRPVVYWWATR